LVKYREGDNVLYFARDYKNVMVVYHGIIVDPEDGLPLVTDKELDAIAAYIGYSVTYKEALKLRDRGLLEFAQTIKQD
jgi:hypothetical protein